MLLLLPQDQGHPLILLIMEVNQVEFLKWLDQCLTQVDLCLVRHDHNQIDRKLEAHEVHYLQQWKQIDLELLQIDQLQVEAEFYV